MLRKKGIEVAGQRCNTAYSLLIDRISEYPIEMVSEVTTVPEETIRTFADLLCRPGMADIFQGYGIDHYGHGFNTIAAVSVLRIMRGMVPEPRMSYPLNSSGFDETETEHPAIVQSLGTFMFNDLLDTGEYTFPGVTAHMGEQVMELPDVTVEQPLKMLISFGANIDDSAPDRNRTIEAYKKFDFLVTANIEWCDTADISDIVLPAATIQEVGGPIGMNGCLVWADKAIEPKFEAKSDYDMANLIGRGLGLDEWFQEEFDEGMKHVVNTAMGAAMGIDADKLKEAGVMYVGAVPMPAYMTMTGKLQFYQENPGPIENYGQPMDPASIALPHWEPPMEAWPGHGRRLRRQSSGGEVSAHRDRRHPPLPRAFLLRSEPVAARDGDQRALRAHQFRRCRGARHRGRQLRAPVQRPRPCGGQGHLQRRYSPGLSGYRPRLAALPVHKRLQ